MMPGHFVSSNWPNPAAELIYATLDDFLRHHSTWERVSQSELGPPAQFILSFCNIRLYGHSVPIQLPLTFRSLPLLFPACCLVSVYSLIIGFCPGCPCLTVPEEKRGRMETGEMDIPPVTWVIYKRPNHSNFNCFNLSASKQGGSQYWWLYMKDYLGWISTGKLWSSIEEEGNSPRPCSLRSQIWWTSFPLPMHFLPVLNWRQCLRKMLKKMMTMRRILHVKGDVMCTVLLLLLFCLLLYARQVSLEPVTV